MRCLSWNCRGLGNPRSVNILNMLVKDKCPNLVFLMETKCSKSRMEEICKLLKFESCLVIDSVGSSGGLTLMWNNKVNVSIFNYSRWHISAQIIPNLETPPWLFTGFYGHPETAKRHMSWELLRSLKPHPSMAWLCCGDFNELLCQNEKQGGCPRPYKQMETFRHAIMDCSLNPIQTQGPFFTWSNNRKEDEFTKERLDRAMANNNWMHCFTESYCQVIPAIKSDHSPLLIHVENTASRRPCNTHLFRFEAAWNMKDGISNIIREAWVKVAVGDDAVTSMHKRILNCSLALKRWKGAASNKATGDIKRKMKELEVLQDTNQGDQVEAITLLQKEIEQSLGEEELKWKQRAKQHWLQNGDRNTKFYHLHASQRRKTNKVSQIYDSNDNLVTQKQQIGEVFTTHFVDLFTSSNPCDIGRCLEDIPTKVTPLMNEVLLQPFSEEEVKSAVFQMKALGSPGPDGFPAIFYQSHWETIGKEVTSFALNVVNDGGSLEGVNETFITLIPKTKDPKRVPDFRPISLCNVIYKIVAKMLSNRLKIVLPDIISPNQSAFVPGRSITDNILVAYETLHTMSTRMKGKSGYMALKLDMSKAYDRVEWSFLYSVMSRLGFHQNWISLVEKSISSVSFSILINGEPQASFKPSRGLRQGDPLSPYLFILCAEALSCMLHKAESVGSISSVPIGKGPQKVGHLFFADDSMIFCKANSLEWSRLMGILEMYERGSGQKLNKEKSSIFFSKNTPLENQRTLLLIAGLKPKFSLENYLGLPAMIGRAKTVAFHGLIDRTWAKITNWKTKSLSSAGKEILIKSVLQAIPTYTMGIFLLPQSIVKRLDQLVRKFWWGFNEDQSKIQWVKWCKLSNSKDQGGMGFRNFSSFNLALLAKQGWNILTKPTSLSAQVLKQKYFPSSNLLNAKLGYRPSLAWRSMVEGLKLLKEGVVWRIGNGCSVNVWKDRWLPKQISLAATNRISGAADITWVSDLIEPGSRSWKYQTLTKYFSQQEIDLIRAIPISLGNREDRIIWGGTKNGLFSVKSAYHLHKEISSLKESGTSKDHAFCENWQSIWKLKVPNVVRNFLWKASSEALPIMDNLHRRKVSEHFLCPICQLERETSGHALWGCGVAKDVWGQASIKIMKMSLQCDQFRDIWAHLTEKLPKAELEMAGLIARLIWNRRNEFVHGKGFRHPISILQKAKDDHRAYHLTRTKGGTHLDTSRTQNEQKWRKPPVGRYKLNWDAALDTSRGLTGIGALVRDWNGKVLGSVRTYRQLNLSPLSAEAYALMVAIQFCKDHGFTNIICEGDSLQVVRKMKSFEEDWSQEGLIIEDAKTLLKSFSYWDIIHTKRDSNMAADLLAKDALNNVIDVCDLGLIPNCIAQVVSYDSL
ncbi:uncharacterized protein LOC122292152 [Carya illinoinensis]|uniref:uncharacterized protein LOC122292152 n=1 Tax=Carya illinoinensis TaxID=32201 RepID=UPI001C71BE7D|nr:uncharacterized protein LOC122292152 [Carya illinoinensis]